MFHRNDLMYSMASRQILKKGKMILSNNSFHYETMIDWQDKVNGTNPMLFGEEDAPYLFFNQFLCYFYHWSFPELHDALVEGTLKIPEHIN